MIIEKDNIKCESVFNEKRTHRFLWKRVRNKDKPLATVITLNPCIADNILMDTTTYLVVNNIGRLEKYGGVIVNLYSKLTSKLLTKWHSPEELNDAVNDNYIRKSAEESEIIVAAWGKSCDNNQQIAERVGEVLGILKEFEDKIYYISDGVRVGIHQLTPSVRDEWLLVPLKEKTVSAEMQEHTDN